MRSRSFVATALLIALATSCNDASKVPTVPSTNGPAPAFATTPPGNHIDALIDSIFTNKGNAQAAHSRWQNVTRQLTRGSGPSAAAKSQYVELVTWIQSKTPELAPPPGETAAHVAARLVLDMSVYVYGGPDVQPPAVNPTSDAVLGIVDPAATTPTTIQTPTQHAAVQFPPGAVAEPTVMVVTQEAANYPQNCSGPLTTHLCQYPQFYKFNAFPDVKLQKPAGVAVCHVDAGSNRRPLADHDRFRLAHDKPVNPADYAPNSTIVDSIEILDLHFFTDLINCSGNTYGALNRPTSGPGVGPLDRWLNRGLNALSRLASAVGTVIAPKSAYAIDQGGGGFVLEFSEFADIDPQSKPDLQITSPLNISPLVVFPGDQVSIGSWSYTNGGSGTSPTSVAAIVLATDTTLSSGAVTLASFGSAAPMAPAVSVTVPAQQLTLPANTAAGVYYLGARLDPANGGADSTTTNNYLSTRIEVHVQRAAMRVCPTELASSTNVATLAQALPLVTDGGTISLCDGTHVASNVAVTRPITITSAGPGTATIDADTGHAALELGGSTGLVKLHRLKFTHGLDASIDVTGSAGTIVIDSSEFDPSSGTGTTHAGINLTNVAATGGVLVRANAFVNGDVGVRVSGGTGITLRRNSFSGQTTAAVLVTDGAAAAAITVDSSGFANCARVACVNAVGAMPSSLTFAADTFLADIAHPVGYAIRDSMPHGTLAANDNLITGTGNNGTDRNAPATYPIDSGAIRVSGTATALRNKITNVARAFAFRDDGITLTGSDNVVTHTASPFQEVIPTTAALTLRMNRNDFNDYSITIAGSSTAGTSLDFRCNYWGGPAPHNAARPSAGAFQWTPWTSQPTAGTTVACDPNAPFTTIRACPAGTSTTPTTATINDAVATVPDNGTVLVCDGTQTVNVVLAHGLTLKAEGPGVPTLDGGSGTASIIFVNGTAQNVVIQGFKFTGSKNGQVSLGPNYTGTATIDHNEFHPFESFPYGSQTTANVSGVQALGTFGTVNVTNNQFIGGDAGVSLSATFTLNSTVSTGGGGTMTVTGNTFSTQTNLGIVWSSGGATSFVSTVPITLHVENNSFDHCGLFGCARVNSMTGGRSEWVSNHFTADISRPTQNGIQLLAGGSALVDHNDFTGTGSGASTDRTQGSVYPFSIDAVLVQNMPATVTRNTVTNAWAGIMLVTNGATTANVTGDHNTVTHVAFPFVSGSTTPSTLVWQKNDFSDYVAPTNSPASLPNADVRCTWWGSSSGPQNPPSPGSLMYLPWANAPIATNASTTCDPNAGVNTIRVCPTPGPDPNSLTTATVANAVALVPTNGTVAICDGTYPVTTPVSVNRSMTITGEGTAVPTLDGGGLDVNQPILNIFGTANVTLRQLKLQNGAGHNVAANNSGALTIDHSEFHPPQSRAYNPVFDPATYQDGFLSGVFVSNGLAAVSVTNSQFYGGDIGVDFALNAGGSFVVKGSHFTGQSNAGVWLGGSSATGVMLHVEADTFDLCGRTGCSKFFPAGGRGEWVNNLFRVDIAHPVNSVVSVDGRNAITMLLDGNQIIGTGGSGDRAQQSSYPIDGFAVNGTGPTSTIVRNTISGAWAAVNANSGTTTLTDNVVSHVFDLISGGGATPITFVGNRNDFSDYLQTLFSTNAFASIDLRCNYWGSPNGPANPGNFVNPTPQYLPWSAGAIANNPSVACNPNATSNTIHVCPAQALDGSMTTNSVLNAYLLAPAGGTVSICDGTWPVTTTVFIQKNITITGEGAAVPTLDGGHTGDRQSIFGVFNTNANVTLKQLRLQNSTGHLVQLGNASGAVVVDHVEFHPVQTFAYNPNPDPSVYHEDYWAGVGAFQGVTSLLVTNSQFVGGDVGMHVNTSNSSGASSIIARGNHFTGQSNAGVFVGDATVSTLVHAEADTFDLCGRFGCTKFFSNDGGRIEWMNNLFRVDISHPVNGIFAIGSQSNVPYSTLIDRNTIIGTGGGGDRTQQTSYPIDGFAISGTAPTTTITGNSITDAYAGLRVTQGTTTASDNTISHVFSLVGGSSQNPISTLALNRSDFSDYVQPSFGSGGFASMDLRCNYWGQVSGPVNPGNFINPTPQYLPFSNVPIANNASVACNPNVATNTIRVCPTATTSDPLTSPDAQTAAGLLTDGGTMRFCDGQHTTSLFTQKALTLTSEGPGVATLIAAPGAPNAVGVGPANGFTIRNLRFQGGQFSNVAINSTTGPVLIDAVQFNPPQTQPYGGPDFGHASGVFIGAGTTAPVTVQNSTFTGGDVGVQYDQASNLTIRGNTFTSQTNAGVTGGNGASTGVLVDGNTFSTCGLAFCVGVFNANGVTINNNQFTIDRTTNQPIVTAMNPSGATVVTNNTITGGGAPGTFGAQSTFLIASNAIQVQFGSAAVNGNRIQNAWNGITFANLSGTASDNVLTHVGAPFGGFGTVASAAINRNDITDYGTELFNTAAFTALNLRCNWWGSATGPANTSGLPTQTFTPFAATPIANQAGVSCTP